MKVRTTLLAAVAASALVLPAMASASRKPTARESVGITTVIRRQIPPAWRPLSRLTIRVSTRVHGFAIVNIVPKPGFEGIVQRAYAYMAGGGRSWQFLDLGGYEVGCAMVPRRVRGELLRSVGSSTNDGCN